MIEVVTELRIYSFDGRVLEVFEINGDTKRYHLAFIQNIMLEDRGRKGYRLNMDYSIHNHPVRLGIEKDYASQMNDLINAVARAL